MYWLKLSYQFIKKYWIIFFGVIPVISASILWGSIVFNNITTGMKNLHDMDKDKNTSSSPTQGQGLHEECDAVVEVTVKFLDKISDDLPGLKILGKNKEGERCFEMQGAKLDYVNVYKRKFFYDREKCFSEEGKEVEFFLETTGREYNIEDGAGFTNACKSFEITIE